MYSVRHRFCKILRIVSENTGHQNKQKTENTDTTYKILVTFKFKIISNKQHLTYTMMLTIVLTFSDYMTESPVEKTHHVQN